MKIEDYLKDEIKRLNRMNDILEKEINKNDFFNLSAYEEIQKNTSAMCDIAKVYCEF